MVIRMNKRRCKWAENVEDIYIKYHDEELLVKFKVNYDTNFSNDTYVKLGLIETIDYLGEYENELVFELYDEELNIKK